MAISSWRNAVENIPATVHMPAVCCIACPSGTTRVILHNSIITQWVSSTIVNALFSFSVCFYLYIVDVCPSVACMYIWMCSEKWFHYFCLVINMLFWIIIALSDNICLAHSVNACQRIAFNVISCARYSVFQYAISNRTNAIFCYNIITKTRTWTANRLKQRRSPCVFVVIAGVTHTL